jgi:hypothetical protein
MKYWYDTEFIEDGKTLDLISIGIVAEDGREYYAQNRGCHFRRASDWVRANVYPHLSYFDRKRMRPCDGYYDAPNARNIWRPHSEIANDVRRFCDPERYGTPELWGYYAAYDHVALCQLFGTMMDLPKGWPMWTHDLMQYRESLGLDYLTFPPQDEGEHNALADARWNRQAFDYLIGVR